MAASARLSSAGAQRDALARRRTLGPEAMSEADRLLHNILEGGDIVGKDDAGGVVIQFAVDRRDFEALMAFGAVESEDGGDDEPYEVTPMSPCWAWEAGRVFTGISLQ